MSLDNILLIPGLTDPVTEIKNLLFAQGQQGLFVAPTLSPTMITGNTFGSGVTDLLDLSGRGNTASQATPSSRAAWFREPWTGRRNLLVQTEPATTATGWTNTGALATNIGSGVMHWVEDTSTGAHLILQVVTIAAGNNVTYSIQVKSDGSGRRLRFFALESASPFTTMAQIIFDTGTNTVISSTGTVSSTSVGDGWFELTLQGNTSGSGMRFQLDGVTSGNLASYTGNGSGFFYRRPQFETGATRTAYQRVTTAFDVTEAGQRDCYGVLTDGIDDGYETASTDFTGTDKITVFASLRKRSDAAVGLVVSNVNIATTGTGAFALLAPSGATTNTRWQARELTGGAQQIASATIAANNNFIVTGQTDGSANNHSIRLNGSLIQTATGDLGTGNFRAGALQILRNNLQPNSPFNGNLYALIVAGGSYSLSTIQRVERLLSRITPTVTL